MISGGQAKTLMFVHISPEYEALGETLSTLKFAERVSTVELGAARVNKDGANVKDLKEQVVFGFFGYNHRTVCNMSNSFLMFVLFVSGCYSKDSLGTKRR